MYDVFSFIVIQGQEQHDQTIILYEPPLISRSPKSKCKIHNFLLRLLIINQQNFDPPIDTSVRPNFQLQKPVHNWGPYKARENFKFSCKSRAYPSSLHV